MSKPKHKDINRTAGIIRAGLLTLIIGGIAIVGAGGGAAQTFSFFNSLLAGESIAASSAAIGLTGLGTATMLVGGPLLLAAGTLITLSGVKQSRATSHKKSNTKKLKTKQKYQANPKNSLGEIKPLERNFGPAASVKSKLRLGKRQPTNSQGLKSKP